MTNKNGLFRVKIEYEEIPIVDSKVRGDSAFDSLILGVKKKMRGK